MRPPTEEVRTRLSTQRPMKSAASGQHRRPVSGRIGHTLHHLGGTPAIDDQSTILSTHRPRNPETRSVDPFENLSTPDRFRTITSGFEHHVADSNTASLTTRQPSRFTTQTESRQDRRTRQDSIRSTNSHNGHAARTVTRRAPRFRRAPTQPAAHQPVVRVLHSSEVQRSTADFKIRVIAAWLKAHGASTKRPATVGLGISLDEIQRVTNRKVEAYERLVYPLLDHDPPLRRTDCTRIIRDAGLPVPGKSACWFCPMRTQRSWLAVRVDEPALFQRVVELEQLLNQRRTALGLRPIWFHHRTKPLDQAVPDGIQPLPLADPDTGCDNGWCMT
jgi:hypothetical protein